MSTPARTPLLVILLFIFSLTSTFGQRLWQSQGEPVLTPAGSERFIYADEAEYFELDTGIWQAVAARIPIEVERLNAEQGFAVEIPMPNGQTETFLLAESPIMESSLASQYPEIKTYVGYCPNHPDWYGKFDFTPQGFHGMILGTSGGTVFIDPVFHGPLYPTSYIAYHRDHFISSANNIFSCDATNDVVDTSLDNGQSLGRFGSCELRTYRLALAATGEYTAFHGGTVALGLAAQNTTMNRVNGVFERDIAITMTIIANNNLLVYTNSGSDPYSNGNAGTMLGQNQSNIDAVIGSANYDIGHVFGVGSGGIAGLGVVCSSSGKARGVTGSGSPVGDPFDIDYVAHEMGHQFSMNHTQNNNCNRNNATAMEPGSASTIMGYAGICAPNVQSNSDDYFHGISLEECGAFITSGSHTCPVKTTLSNSEPVISSTTSNVTIPANTPFSLTAIATDPDAGDVLTYCWEQMDNQTGYTMPPSSTSTGGPMFRSLDPNTSPTRYFPDLQDLIAGNVSQWEVLPGVSRSMDFRVTVRDNASGGGCNDHADITLTVDENAGPFLVQNPNNTGITWDAATSETVTWDVAGTASGAVSCGNVDILLSTDGGLTFSTIASNVPNSGSASVNVPNSPTTNGLIMVQCANGSFFDISDNTFTINQITNDYTITTATSNESVCAGGNVSYTIDLTAFGTFSDPVSLSVSGGGIGTSANLSASNVTPTASVNLNVSTTSAASGLNTFTVTASSTTGTKTLDLFLDVLTTPSSPSLLAPVNGVTTANPATLTWSSAANETYDVSVFSSINPNVVFESATGLTTASYTTSALTNTTTYYYQVTAVNACGSATSGIDSFTTSTCLTYTNTTDYPGSTAGGTFIQSPINVSVSPTAQVSSVSIPNMQGDMTYISDLEIILISPTGTQTSLIRYSNYCNNEDDWNHGLEDGGLNLSGLPCPPTDGLIYNPENPFSSFNNELVDGDWTLIVYDYFNGDAATLTEWTMELCTFDPCGGGFTTNQNFSGCDSYIYNGTTYTSSTTVTENLTTASGCDSTVNTTITINPSATTNQSFTGCDSYVYNGTTYTSSTTVTENLTAANGCDSTVNTTITINPSATTNQSFVGCDSYVYNGTTYTSSTTVTENLTAANGCDSTVNTTITINPSATTNQSFVGCDSYVYNGTTYTSSTTVTENLFTIAGCDSTVNTTITINPSATTNQSFVGCDSYIYNGTTYTSSTTVTENLFTIAGCDSTVNTTITINPSASTNQSFVGCDSYIYNGTTYTSSTTVTENLTTASGCDSTVNTTITINPSATTNQSFTGCDSYVYNGTTYTSSTTVTENLTAANGCDSTVNTTITINPSATTNQSFVGCDSYVYNGTTYTSSTTVTENLFTIAGCDSTVNTAITINPSATTNQSFTGCNSYVYNGTTYTSSTTLTENLFTVAGCDSTVNTTITINPSASTNQSFVGCDSYIYNGTTYTSSTTVTENLFTIAGCDSTVNTTITINPSATTNQSFVGCDSYIYNGTTYTSSTTVTENLFTIAGCDSTVNTTITINPSATTNQSFVGCDSYVYNGTTYTSSTTVTENLFTIAGCDSIVNTTITINPSATTNQSFVGCDSYVYNGTTYTSSTTLTENLFTVAGCDSTVNTTITINSSASTNQSFVGCDSYVYNGTTYTSSTTVTENLFTIAGCDSTVNTTITINPSATTNQSFSGCDSYVYNGTTYTSSTTVTEDLFTIAGCDSTVNTTITITPIPSPPAANGASIVAGNSATLSASGAGSGQSYAWLTSNGTLVGNGASYTTPILNTTTIYFVEISDDASNCTSSRTTVIVTVTSPDILWTGNTSSDWNVASNWSTNLVPSLSDSVTIPSNNVVNYPIIQNDVAIGHTTVEAFASITIAPNGILRLSDELINNGLVLLQSDISGDGVLMDTLTNANFVGSLSIERYNPGDQFHIIGSPVASSMTGLSNDLSGPTGNGLTGSDGLAVTPDLTTSIYLNSGVCDSLVIGSNYGNLFSYDESLVQNCSFEGWVVESAGTLVPGKGYMAYLTPGATIDLDGPPNTGSITGPSLTNSGGTTFTGAGWNLVSNPYPSYFDVEEFIVGNNGVNSPNVFVDTGLYSGTYSSILPVTGQSVVALGQGFVIRNGGDNATAAINPLYSNAMRETSGTGFRSPASNRLKVDVIQDNLRDKTEVYWAQGGHEGFHRFEDGYKFKGLLHQPQIGSLLEDELMAVQTLPETEDLSRIIPLVVNGIESPMYSIEVDPDFIPLAYHVFLIDNAEGRRYNTRILPEIPFQNLGNEERRFDIEITKSSLHADDLDFLENIEVYQSNNQLIVAPQNTGEATYRIDVYDVLGRCLMTKPLTAGRQVILLNTPSQLLNIRLSSGAHQHTVKTWWQVD